MAKNAPATLIRSDQVAALEAALKNGPQKAKRRPGPPCGLGKILESLPEDISVKVLAAIDDPENTLTEVAEMLDSAGFDVSPFMVGRHRRRGQVNGCKSCAR